MPQIVNTARIEIHSLETLTLTDRQFLTGAREGKASRIGGELRLPPGADGVGARPKGARVYTDRRQIDIRCVAAGMLQSSKIRASFNPGGISI